MTLIKNFKELSKSDILIAGGKGASLGEMTQAGVPVPSGFVILANTFNKFLEETDVNIEIDAILDKVNIKEIHTVENASEKIRAIILSKEIPEDIKKVILNYFKKLDSKYVAVRSSATSEDSVDAAWAGQLDSFINTTNKKLLENVKKCWASLFTPRAIFYRFEKKLNKDKISVAVVVQKMVDSEESGIAFSVHPVTQDKNQIIIEAGFGLGEAIVSGSITPDSYVVDKQGFNILDINVNEQSKALYKKSKGGNDWKELGERGKKQVLSKKEIITLSKHIVKIENHYGFPCDIEWAKENGKFYIVQSRPITTLSMYTSNRLGLKISLASNESIKTVAKKIDEKWFVLRARYIPALWPINTFYEFGFKKSIIPTTGHIIVNYDKGDETTIFESDKMSMINKFMAKKLMKNTKNLGKIRKKALDIGEDVVLAIKSMAERAPKASINEFLGFMDKFLKINPKITQESILYWAYGSIEIEKKIRTELKNYGSDNLAKIFSIMSFPLEDSYSKKIENEFESLVDLAKEKGLNSIITKKQIKKFSDKYFWFPYEYVGPDIWDEKSVYARIKDSLNEKNKNKIKNDIGIIQKQKKCIKEYNLSKKIIDLFKISQTLSLMADDRKEINCKICYYFNGIVLRELAKKINISWEEALYIDQNLLNLYLKDENKFLKRIRARSNYLLVDFIDGEANFYEGEEGKKYLKSLGIKIQIANNDIKEIQGEIANKGVASGRVRVLKTSQVKNFNTGEIIVTGMTTPDFAPLMKKAAAIITDEGGITCHAAIISREYDIPCIIGTKIATKILKDGDMVEVNANNGIVKIIKKSKIK